MIKRNAAFLLLSNGAIFEGAAFGAAGDAIGEIVFTTEMGGYLKSMTDPGNFGHILVQTFPTIGNYGVIPDDFLSDSFHIKAYVVREWCRRPSNFRSEGDIDSLLKSQGVPGIYNIDTRRLVRIIRENGALNALLTRDDPRGREGEILPRLKSFKPQIPFENVGSAAIKSFGGEGVHLVVYDFGLRRDTLAPLLSRGARITLVPWDTSAEKALSLNPGGIVLSGGPGSPLEMPHAVSNIKALMSLKIPILGVDLGHQLMALAAGARVERLFGGHRGANIPIRDTKTKKLYITSQNHAFAVGSESVGPSVGNISFENVNDLTCEGISYGFCPALSVQFFPDDSLPGAGGLGFIIDEFFALTEGER